MTDAYEKKAEAFAAWQACKITDAQLDLAITSVTDALETLRAMGDGGHFLTGIQLSLESMRGARDSRRNR